MALVTPNSIEGVWVGISHQTITVTSLKSDQSFSGTYFTPPVDLRATFAGKWSLENEVLTLEYTESDSPAFQVPLTDRNRIELDSADAITLHTLPQGISIEWKRVKFASHWSEERSAVKQVDPPSKETLTKLTLDDLLDSNPLSEWVFYLIDTSREELFDDKMVDALKTSIPEKAGYYYAISQFEGLWGNGGMQHVLLREEISQTQFFLNAAAEGYEHFDSPQVAMLIRDLAAKTISWMKQIKSLNDLDAPEEEFEPIWSEVDAYDDVFDKLLEEECGAYDALLKDIRTSPQDYTTKPTSRGR
ncbi:MAG: DMP19 family protein [Opitutales bacterium]